MDFVNECQKNHELAMTGGANASMHARLAFASAVDAARSGLNNEELAEARQILPKTLFNVVLHGGSTVDWNGPQESSGGVQNHEQKLIKINRYLDNKKRELATAQENLKCSQKNLKRCERLLGPRFFKKRSSEKGEPDCPFSAA